MKHMYKVYKEFLDYFLLMSTKSTRLCSLCCLSVSQQVYSKTTEPTSMIFGGWLVRDPRMDPHDFGVDSDKWANPGIFPVGLSRISCAVENLGICFLTHFG